MGLLDEFKNQESAGFGDLISHAQTGTILSRVVSMINDPAVGGVSGIVQTFQTKGLGGIAGGARWALDD